MYMHYLKKLIRTIMFNIRLSENLDVNTLKD